MMQSKCAFVGINYGQRLLTCQHVLTNIFGIFMSFGSRLAEERKKLGLNQTEFALLGGVTKTSQVNYESGSRSPDAAYWSGIAAAGADVQYILTGMRAGGAVAQPTASYTVLTPREAALLDNYRHIDDEGDKRAVERMVQLADPREAKDEAKSRTKKTG